MYSIMRMAYSIVTPLVCISMLKIKVFNINIVIKYTGCPRTLSTDSLK